MNVQDFFRQWTGTRPKLNIAFHEAGIEAMAFAEAYHNEQLRLHIVMKCPNCGGDRIINGWIIPYKHYCRDCAEHWN